MDVSSLHCDFTASSGFDSESNHVDFDKAVKPFFLPDGQTVFAIHLANGAFLVTCAAAELFYGDVGFRDHEIDLWAH